MKPMELDVAFRFPDFLGDIERRITLALESGMQRAIELQLAANVNPG